MDTEYTKKLNVRFQKEQYEDMVAYLKEDESISDFIRTAVDCLIVSRAASARRQKVSNDGL